jgi:DNA polymerase
MVTKLDLLNRLNEKVCNCEKCPDLVANRTKTVFSSGNPNAKILFLGEAPGQDEDEQGEAFVGRAGQLLTSIIAACGWEREKDVYICNIVKCRPPKNRTPTEVEAKNCEPYLKLQIKIINPRYIICLGATATRYLLGVQHPMGYMRGKWFKYEDAHVNADVLCTYHPSYLLRNPAAKVDVAEDMQSLVEAINETVHSR